MDSKQNDWVLLTLQNPDLTTTQFENGGFNATNTSIYDRDRYMNSNLIQGMDLFQTDGRFDKSKFNRFYDLAITSYNNLSDLTYSQKAMEAALFSYNNLAVSREKRTKAPGWDIVQISNPDRRNYSTERLGFISDPKFTPQEIALNEKIWNNKTQKWEDSPNDSWLFRNWTEPVAMATWDFNADANGNPTNDENAIVYRKGEYKINPETGTYYYEKLNGKSPYGKELLTPFDIITKDGSKANDYDFFDSDGLDKNLVGSVMKNVARIAPMFIPYVGPIYVGANIALELGKVLPIVYKSTFGLAGGDLSLANTIEGMAMSFDNNKVSYAGRENFFNSENILNMIGDVAKLLYEQRWIFSKAPRAFKKYSIEGLTGKTELDKAIASKADEYTLKAYDNLEHYVHLGKDLGTVLAEAMAKASIWGAKYQEQYQDLGKLLSRLYMTGTSSYNAFSDAKEMGASDTEAAAMFWGYFAGMYWLMGTEVGEHVLPELRLEKQQIKNMLQEVARTSQPEIKKGLDALADSETVRRQEMNVFKRLFTRAAEAGKNAAKSGIMPVTTGDFNSVWSNMLAEGIEEVSEEVLYDVTRSTFDILAKFSGSDTRLSQWDTALERYGQSFIGGAIGGGIFQGINDINIRRRYDSGNVDANQELIYMIRNGKKSEIKRALTDLYKNLLLGNPNLGTRMENVDNGEIVYKEGTADDNLNLAVYNLMNQYVDFIDETLSTENMLMPDDAIMSDDSINGREILQEIRYRSLMANPMTSLMLQDYNSMAAQFLDLHSKIDQLNGASDEEKQRDPQWQEKMDNYAKQLNELRDRRDKFFDLENLERYRGIMMFGSNQGFAEGFANVTYKQFVNENYHKEIDDLTDYERELSTKDYDDYLKYYAKDQIGKAYDFFMKGLELFSTTLSDLGETGYRLYAEVRNAFLDTKIQVPDANGQMRDINFMQFVAELYGIQVESDEEFLKLAEDLKTRYNPFDEIAAYVIKKGNSPVGANLLSTLAMFQTLSDNLRTITGQFGFVDEFTAKTIDKISKDATAFDTKISESLGSTLNSNLGPQDPGYNEIADAIAQIALGFDISLVQQKLRDFIDAVNNSQAEDTVKQELINVATAELNGRYTPELIQAYNNIQLQIANVAQSPVAKFLETLKITNSGLNIFEIINKSLGIFKSKDISEFVIDGELDISDIQNARNILRQLRTYIRAMMFLNVGARTPYGFTSQMNVIRKKIGKDELGVLETADAQLMLHDIAQLDSKLRFVERLHNMNHETSLKEQSRVQVKLYYEAFKMLGNTEAPIYKDKEFNGEDIIGGELGTAINAANTIRQLVNDQGEPLDLSEEDSLAIEQEMTRIEDAFYDRIVELCNKYGTEEVFRKLLHNVIDTNQLDTNSPGITSRTTQLSETDKLGYLMSILSVKTSDFLYKYSPIVELSDLAPIPIQELSIRLGYGLSRNKNLFNLVLDILDVPGGSPLRNAMFISGVPGAGKTNAILKILYEMLHKDNDRISTITCGPGKQQVDNLTVSLNPSDNKPMTKELLFLWLGLDLNDVNNESSGKIKDGKLILGNQGAYSDTDIPDVIFIDEATHFTNLELLRIAEYCNEKGTILILAGDPDQTGKRNFITVADEQGQGHMINNAFLTVICICTPKSTVSMRDSNSNKRDNNELTKALATEWNLGTIQQDAAATGKSADEYLLDLLDKIVLKGTEHTSGIYGDLVVDSVSEELVIKLIENLNQGEKVGYIYSDINSPTYALMERLKQNSQYAGQIEIKSALEFFDEGSAQGSENLFFIVDIDWDAKAANLNPGGMEPLDYVEYLNFVKSIYTTTTRSKQGSYILDRGFTAIFGNNVSKIVPIDAVSKVSMNDLSLTNHKQRRLDRIRSIILGHTPNGAAYPDLNSNSPQNNPLGNGNLQQGSGLQGTQPLSNPAQGGQTNTINVSDTAPAKQTIAVNRVDAANFDPSTTNFTDNVVGVYLMPANKVDDVELNGYVKIKKTNPLWYTVATAQEIQSQVDNLPNDLALFVITFPKSATNETLVGTIAPPGSFIGNNHVAAVITNNLPLTTQGGNPPQGNPPSGGLTTGGQTGNSGGSLTGGGVNPINLNKFKVGYIKQYNSKLCKIINVNDPNITVEYIDGSLETLNLQDFAANASNGTKKAWDDAVQAANLPTQPDTKFKVGDLLAINQDDGTPLKNAVYKVVGIAYENNSWKYILKNEKTGFTTKPKVETVDGNEVKYVTVLESTPKQRKPLSITISDEALVNIIKHADSGPGIMLYTSFGIREGMEFERDADGNLLSNGTSYTIKRVGETGNPNNAMQDMLALLGITAPTTMSVSDYNAAKRCLYQVQSALKFGKLNARFPIHKQVEALINEFRLTRNIGRLQLNEGRFLIKLLPENNNTVFDRGVNYFPDSPKVEAKQNKCLVYTVEDTNGNLYEFYMGTIATESTNQTFILSIKQALTEQVNAGQMSLQDANKVISAWETAGTTIKKVNDIVKLNGSLLPITYIPLADNFEPSSLLITNSKLVGVSIEGNKTSGDTRHSMLLDNFRNSLSRIVSPPQIITGKNIAKAGLDPSMAGKPVVFVTHDLLLKYRAASTDNVGKLITDPLDLANLWDIAWTTDIPKEEDKDKDTKYLRYLREVRLKIKVVTLNSIGYTFKEVMESQFAFRNSLDQRGTNGTGIILPLDNSNTGARMLELLLNLEADILEYLKIGSSTAIDVSKGKFKGLPKFDDIDLLKNFERELRWLLVRTIKTTSDWDGYTEAVKKRKLKEYLDLRDASIKLLYGIGNSDDYSTILPTDADIQKLRNAYGNIIHIQGIDNQALSWTRGGALQVTGKPISTKVMLSLAQFFSERVQGSSEWKLSSKKSRFLNKLSNVISYYRNERAIDKNNFTHGIFYTPIYNPGEKGSSRTAEKMCYPALDIPNTYVVDVDAQSPDMILDGNAYLAIVLATSGVATVQRLQSQLRTQPQQRTLPLLRTQPLRRTAQQRTLLGGTQQGGLLGGTQETGDLPDGTKTSDWKEYAKLWLEYYIKQVFGETPLTLDLQSVIAYNSYHSKAEAEITVNNLINKEIQRRINLFNVSSLPEDSLLTWNKVNRKNVYKPIKEFIIQDFMNEHPFANISGFIFIPDLSGSEILHGEFIADGTKYTFISDGFTGHLFTRVAPEATLVLPWSTDELKTLANDLKSYAESHVADNPAYLPILDALTNLIENYAILSDDEIAEFGIMLQLIMDTDDDFKSKFEELITEEKDCLNKLVAMFKQLSMM